MTLNPHVKLTLDILPLAVFFAGYKWFGLFTATTALIVVTLAILALTYWIERRIALSPLITAIVVAIFGGLALWLHNETFIKVKPTIVNLIFAVVLLSGCFFKRGLLKHIFGTAFNLTSHGWFLLSRRWGLFFLLLAALNELVWRNFPTSTWVNFKVFGLIGLTLIFAMMQAGFIIRHQAED